MKNKLVKTENEHLHASGGMVIPFEVADGITLANLQGQLDYHLKEVLYYESSLEKRAKLKKKWGWSPGTHPEDYGNSKLKYIPALELLIEYYGGSLK
jgi:hypothetical protein